ncbi:LuxR C-terminal-related transcriptional regulator [Lentzea aerocolonigenes]|uniref:LuxR C-terminal-related transcriptional regulator n=1 Tax=Lentzea aerocolonigenes TaxID=68170 RepID=UPI0009E02B5F|nr:LuxR C-terminal-related transcriptional regulator [Lentzea aerocolonigenes]MCP2245837.1 LuxR family transcriptional regulator, maltose regulon positive regulatory protein [Lentzea aerocolonigenes]
MSDSSECEPHSPETGQAKLRVPTAATPLVRRGALLSTVDDHVSSAPVTVVTGPAGCGKTTLLAEWARRRGDRVAWLTLDEHDNQPARLRAAIRDALGLTDAIPLTEPAFSSAVVAAFDQVPASVCLVLDNVHEIRDAEALASIDLLTRRPPDRLRLVLLGRFPPALHLGRLHLEGRLREVLPDEFAFGRGETEALLAAHGVELSPADVDLLLRRTEGWIGGLRFAVMNLAAGSAKPDELLMFAGLDQVVSRYLGEEVLARHPQRVRDLLVATSVCDTVSAELAGALTGHPSPGVVLDALERTNSFVSRLEAAPEWYRCHPVLRAHLSAELRRSRPADEMALHRTAAHWYHHNDEPAVALRHALRAGDDQLTAEIVEHSVLQEVLREGSGRLRAVVDAVPVHVLARPQVGVVAALVAMDAGDVAAADRVLTGLGGESLALRQDRVRVLHATALLRRGRFDARLGEALRVMARTAAGRGGTDAEVAALLNRGVAAMLSGDHAGAEHDLVRASAIARQERFDHAVLDCQVHLAALTSASGDIRAAARQAGEALEFAAEKGWQSHFVCALAYTLVGVQAYLRLDDARAVELAGRAVLALGDRPDPATSLAVSTLDAAVSFPTAGDPRAVVGRVREQWQDVAGRQVVPPVIAHIAPAVQRIALRSGDEQWASAMPEQVEAMFGPCGEQAVLRAVVHTHHARVSQARKAVEPLLSGDLPALAVPTVVDGWLLEAVLVDRSGDQRRAHEAVTRALAAAEPVGALRPFLNAGKPVRDLLARGAGRFGRLESFATTTMTALPAASTASTDVLTSRERDLLLELPSMRTTEEIADSLFVSVNTVKTHLRGIYRKLGVNQRRDAVLAARRLGLI